MKKFVSIVALTLMLLPAFAQQQSADAYRKVLAARTDKIVQMLGVTDAAQYKRVVAMVINQYATVGSIQDVADSTVKALKTEGLDKETLDVQRKACQNERDAQLYSQHAAFLAQLQGELNPEQVEGVKNGLTYNVLNVTYKATLEMIPSLKEDEKLQIRIWLLEAREHAIDASSSDSKHGWFGKYKGRINNYLSARGYDLTKERAAWAERIKQQKTNP